MTLRRTHLVELEDLPWFPARIRDYGTDYLRAVERATGLFEPVAPMLAEAMREAGTTTVMDLCSGGGGPWPEMAGALSRQGLDPQVVLTDLYPNQSAFAWAEAESGGAVRGWPMAVDATRPPQELVGFRTLFNALHHFRPETASAILAAAARDGAGIGVFEFTERSVRGLLAILLAPLFVLLITPTIRPFRWSRLFWTYLVPVVPLFVLWDGVSRRCGATRRRNCGRSRATVGRGTRGAPAR